MAFNDINFPSFRLFVRRICIAAAVFAGFSLLIYAIRFIQFPIRLSEKNENWGDFGSYVSGIVGTILSFINILLITYFTVKLNNGRYVQHQHLTNLRFHFYNEAIHKLHSLTSESCKKSNDIKNLISWLETSVLRDLLLIPESAPKKFLIELNERKQRLIKSLQNLENEKIADKQVSEVMKRKNEFLDLLRGLMLDEVKVYMDI